MIRPRPPDELIFRPVEERDGPALAGFTCSTGAPYEDDVEHFVRGSALQRATAPDGDYQLLVVLERERLVGVAGHHPELLLVESGEIGKGGRPALRGMAATRLHVLALSLDRQGRMLTDGRRLSDLVMETLISEAIGDRTEAVLTAVAARDNLRSLAVCTRHGLTSQVEYDASHLRLSGRFTRRG